MQTADVVDNAVPHKRLATGQADLADAFLDRDRGETFDLLERQHLVVRLPRDALGGHAVDATQVAAVGQADAKVVDTTAVRVGSH